MPHYDINKWDSEMQWAWSNGPMHPGHNSTCAPEEYDAFTGAFKQVEGDYSDCRYPSTTVRTDQTDEDYQKKKGNDRGRRNRNQYKFRHPENANPKSLGQGSNQNNGPDYTGYKLEYLHQDKTDDGE